MLSDNKKLSKEAVELDNTNIFLRIDVNRIAIIMLLLVYILAFQRLERQDTLNRLFNKVSLLVIFQLLIETLTIVVNRKPQQWLIPTSIVLHLILFIASPILSCYWYILARKIVFRRETQYMKHHFILSIPVLINTILTLLSPMYHFIFYIDSSNVYYKGTHFYISLMISYLYMIFGLSVIIIHRNRLPKQDYYLLLVINILPLCGGIIQIIIHGPLLVWSCTAFSLVISFIFLQQRMVHLDDLTGAWDRGSFGFYIGQKIQYQKQKFGLIYVDIDKLKVINDKFGHTEGDEAIKMAVDLIRREINKKDIIVRMGGDEFLIIIECDSLDYLKQVMNQIETAFEHHNLNNKKSYQLECSLGCDIYDPDKKVSIDKFIAHIDNLMYQHKNDKRASERNKELVSSC